MLLRHLFDIRISHIAVSKSKAMNLFEQIIIAFIDSSVSAGCAVPNLKCLIKITSQRADVSTAFYGSDVQGSLFFETSWQLNL